MSGINYSTEVRALNIQDATRPVDNVVAKFREGCDLNTITDPTIVIDAGKLGFSDGKVRSNSGITTWNVTNDIGELGFADASDRSVSSTLDASDKLYLYAVPKSADDTQWSVVLSDNPPSVGPTGYPVFRYLLMIRTDSSADFIKIIQVGEYFEYQSTANADTQITSSGPADTNWHSLDCSSFVPEGCKLIHLRSRVAKSGSVTGMEFRSISSGDTGMTHVTPTSPSGESSYWNGNVPLDSSQQCEYVVGHASPDNFYIKIIGYYDPNVSLTNSVFDTNMGVVIENFRQGAKLGTITDTTIVISAGNLGFSDGKVRKNSSSVTWDASNDVDELGFADASDRSVSSTLDADDKLYMYAVPKSSNDDQWTVVLSDNPPSVGPTGYTYWRYLFMTLVDSSADFMQMVQQDRNWFEIINNPGIALRDGSYGDQVYHDVDASSYVPENCRAVSVGGTAYGGSVVVPVFKTKDSGASHIGSATPAGTASRVWGVVSLNSSGIFEARQYYNNSATALLFVLMSYQDENVELY